MEKEELDDVLKFLSPYFRFISSLIAKKDIEGISYIRERIIMGKKKGKIEFFPGKPEFVINFYTLKKEKNKKWIELLEKQFDIIVEILSSIK